MGRPRHNLRDFALVTNVDRSRPEKTGGPCRREEVSVRKLLRSVVKSHIDEPVYRFLWREPTTYENADPLDYRPATYKAIDWLDPNIGHGEFVLVQGAQSEIFLRDEHIRQGSAR